MTEEEVCNSKRKDWKHKEIELPAPDESIVIEAVAKPGLRFRKSLLGPLNDALLLGRAFHRANNYRAA